MGWTSKNLQVVISLEDKNSEELFLRCIEMQEPRALALDEVSNPKSRKKKSRTQMATGVQSKGYKAVKPTSLVSREAQKGSKRNLKNNASPPYQTTDRSTPDSLADASGSNNEYRTLRHRYLLLEEENFFLGNELGEVEEEVKKLEDEKFSLLDQLVVLEGLMDPSELKHGVL